jgi:tetratricopeptide (TPR) repeat protein
MPKRNSHTLHLSPYTLALDLSWKHVALCAVAMALSAVPSHAQLKTKAEIGPGPTSGPVCGINAGMTCGAQTLGDIPPLMKPEAPNDEKCLPWNLSGPRDKPLTLTTLKVPSKARGEYDKACSATQKKKFADAEQHARGAIEKFQNYPAAWVMLGVVLDEQDKMQEARDACSQATKIDEKYLPAYLCAAEFSARNKEWDQLLTLANAALRLNSGGDGYAYYYRAKAYLHLHNLVEAQRSALQAIEINVEHDYLPLYFLLAQIYDARGDKASAEAQLRQILKRHIDRQQEEVAKKYLSDLEAKRATPVSEKTPKSTASADAEALARDAAESADASMMEKRKPNEIWLPQDIDDAVPPVASGVACALPAVLNAAGRKIVELVQNVDRFTATEVLTHRPIDRSGNMGSPITVKFNYLVSFAEGDRGLLRVDESRNGNQSLEQFPSHIATIGTPSMVLVFHPRYVDNFKMTCEGLGEWHGQPAWQVRFEQRTDRPNLTLSFVVNQASYDVNLRGRAWILADSFQVARLETDLEQSIPKIRLRLYHESVEYRPSKSAMNNVELWLPSSTELYMDFQGHRFYREHSFTDFRIFSVETQYQINNPKRTKVTR